MRLAPWQRTVLAILAAVVLVAVLLYVWLDTSYSTYAVHHDTAIGTKDGSLVFREEKGRITLVLTRGEGESRLGFTDTGWREEVVVDVARTTSHDLIDLSGPGVRVCYRKFRPFDSSWEIGDGGVQGYVHILSGDANNVTVRYDIVIDAIYRRRVPEARHERAVFRGRSTFAATPRPTTEESGIVWPKPRMTP
jgi:hypothetical protein